MTDTPPAPHPRRSARTPGAPPPVEVRGLVKRYGELEAVAGVDLTVHAGDVYGYLGPNGAGKTTCLRMMLGLIRPTEGSVRLFGRDPLQETVQALDDVAGFVEAPTFYPYLSGRRNLELLAAFDGGDACDRIDQALETVELTDRARDKIGGYSHGMRQRIGIAAALLRDPQAAAARRAGHRARSGRDARHAAADPPSGRPGDDRAALEPPARRGRGAVQPGGDRPHRQDRLRGRDRRPQAGRRRDVPAVEHQRRARDRGVPRPAGHRRRADRPREDHASPPTRRRSPICRRRWSRRAR